MDYTELVQIADDAATPDKALLVCIPSSVKWEEYEKELKAVENWKEEMFFKVANLPTLKCDRCYLAHQGKIKGWMKVTGYQDSAKFKCSTTGKEWEGKFIKRSGPFHKVKEVNCAPFRGFHYIVPRNLGLE